MTIGNRKRALTIREVRLLIGDISEEVDIRFFSDADIRVFISMAPRKNPLKAVYYALHSLATTYAGSIGEIKVLGYSGDGATVAKALIRLAEEYNISTGPIPLDTSIESITDDVGVPSGPSGAVQQGNFLRLE